MKIQSNSKRRYTEFMRKLARESLKQARRNIALLNPSEGELLGEWTSFSACRFFHYVGDLPFDLGRSSRGLAFRREVADEFDLLSASLCSTNETEQIESALIEAIHLRYQKESTMVASELLGLGSKHKLAKYPCWALVLPWEDQPIEERVEIYPCAVLANRRNNGLQFPSNATRQQVMDIAYSRDAAASQARQFGRLAQLLSSGSNRVFTSAPTVVILSKGKRWFWMMSDEGNHRAYIANQLGWVSFGCRVRSLVRFEDAHRWPNVVRGLYTAQEARELFNKCLDGNQRIRGLV